MHFREASVEQGTNILCRYLVCIAHLFCLLIAVGAVHAADFTFSGSLLAAREGHTATLLQNGKVLIAGGTGAGGALSSAELYDLNTGTFTATAGGLGAARGFHTATMLPNGKVLIVGGYNGTTLSTAEIYDPVTKTFALLTDNLTTARYRHIATLLENGKVLIAGGQDSLEVTLTSAELFDPSDNTFNPVALPMSNRMYPTETLLPGGKVLFTGGLSTSAELFDPLTSEFSPTGSFTFEHFQNSATLLANRKVLIAGGYNNAGEFLYYAELYDSTTGTSSIIASFINSVRESHSATLLPSGRVLFAGGIGETGYLKSSELYDFASGTFTLAGGGGLNIARKGHTATLLPSGQVLLVGGVGVSGYLNSAELYTPPAGSFTSAGTLTAFREQHTATPLTNGKILLAGGKNGDPLNSSELYDPILGTRVATGSLTTARFNHSATLLSNGKVLMIGGKDGTATPLASAELFDPNSGTSGSYTPISTGSLAAGRYGHSATLLPNGKVLVTGGTGTAGALDSAELFDLVSGTFAAANGAMQSPRTAHTATLLANGSVLLAGGANGGSLASAELFNPATGLFTTTAGSLVAARSQHSATLLPSGKVLLAGGENGATLASAELFNPATGTFATITAGMSSPRKAHTATLLTNGAVLMTGGSTGAGYAGAELYDPAAGNLVPPQGSFVASAGSLGTPRSGHTASLLTNGKVLIAGGTNGPTLNSTELFDLGIFNGDARRPIVSTISPTAGQPLKLILAGSGFQSDTEGSGGGTNSSATNYPLFRLQRVDNDLATYVVPDPAASWSATSLQTTSLYGLQAGYYQAAIVANAIPSHTRLLRVAPLSAATPMALDFPNAELNVASGPQDVTITNNGTADLQFGAKLLTPNDGKFSITAGDTCLGTLLPGASCLVPVIFQTSTTGNVAATLAIQSNDPDAPVTTIALTGSVEALPAISVEQAALDFPNGTPGSPSVAQAVQITNTGNADLLLGAKTFAPSDGKFSIAAAPSDTCVGTLAPAASCTFSVIFQTGTVESVAATLAISSNDPLIPVKSVVLTGATVAPIIAVTPLALDFPNATPNVLTAPQSVQIRNNGNAPLVPGAKTFSPADGTFSIGEDTCVASLAPSAVCTFKVSFLAPGPGNVAVTLSLASNDPVAPLQQIALTGSALAPIIAVTPEVITFPNVSLNVASAPLLVQISNVGNAPLQPGAKTFSPNDGRFSISNDTCGVPIAPAASCTFNVTFQTATPGAAAATLAIASNDVATPVKNVAINGFGLAPIIAVTPASRDFSNASLNVQTAPQAVLITNSGNDNLLIGARTFTPNDGRFSIDSDTCGTSLAPGGNCTVSVVFLADTLGPVAATLAIASNDLANPLKIVALTGTALAPLSIAFGGAGSGTVLARSGQTVSSCSANCSREYVKDTPVTLIAQPAVGATFAGWTGCDTVAGTACMVTMSSNRSANATFGTPLPGGNVGIATGFNHSLALKSDGNVWGWGSNASGQLGNGVVGTISTIPVHTATIAGVTAVAAGYSHSLALQGNGTVWSWGANGSGQLGNGSTTASATPVPVSGLAGVIALAGGSTHTLALKDDGTVWSWGANGSGQLGNGSTTACSTPVQVMGLTDIIAIAAGGTHSVALKNDGSVWTWGGNSSGQLGNGSTTVSSTPVTVSGLAGVIAIAAGNAHTVALKSTGTVWAWGQNSDGQLGNSSNTSSSSPVAVTGLAGVSVIAAGSVHTLALKNDGTVWAWGDNYTGQLGRGMPVESIVALDVPTLAGVTALASLGTHTLALKSDGSIWAWGWNGSGQIGNGTSSGYVPVITPEKQQPLYVKLQIAGQYDSYFPTVGAAVNYGATTPLIKTLQQVYGESLDINQCGQIIALGGAYDPTYTTLLGPTVIQGAVTVSCGTLLVEALEIW